MKVSAHLVGVSGAVAGAAFLVGATPLSIGRSPDATISMASDALVSRKHANVFWQGDSLVIADLGSSNGTTVNGYRISGICGLSHGSTIQIGSSTFRVEFSLGTSRKNRSKNLMLIGSVFATIMAMAFGTWIWLGQKNLGPVGLWIEPILNESAYEFKPGGDFILYQVDDPNAATWNWSQLRGHYTVDGNRVVVDYSPGQFRVGRDSWTVLSQSNKSLSLQSIYGDNLNLVPIPTLPKRRPAEAWEQYNMGGGPPRISR